MIVERRLLMGACLAGMLGFKLTSTIINQQSAIIIPSNAYNPARRGLAWA